MKKFELYGICRELGFCVCDLCEIMEISKPTVKIREEMRKKKTIFELQEEYGLQRYNSRKPPQEV